MKVAIVYDRVNKVGGAERVLLVLHRMFPKAPLYTSVCDYKKAPWVSVFPKVYTSFLQKIPFLRDKHELLGSLMPLVFESFNFDDYDLVISVTSEAAKGVITKPGTVHVCYMLTPTRYLWSHSDYYFRNKILKFLASPMINYLKNWEAVAAGRPDKIISISKEVSCRVKHYYNKSSEIIHPPLTLGNDNNFVKKEGKYYLVVSRLTGYKRVDLVVNAFNKLGLPLKIVGSGFQKKALMRKARKNINFLGFIDDKSLSEIYKMAIALIMPQEEDFGLVSLEAQYYGVPVIAYKKGGVCDTVINGVTGITFSDQSVEGIVGAIAIFHKMRFNHNYLRQNAEKFKEDKFVGKLRESLIRSYPGGRRGNTSLAEKQK